MKIDKIYYDTKGNEVNLLQLIKKEPEWAANRIQEGRLEQEHKNMMRELLAFIKDTLSEYNATPDEWDHLYAILGMDS